MEALALGLFICFFLFGLTEPTAAREPFWTSQGLFLNTQGLKEMDKGGLHRGYEEDTLLLFL